MSGSQVKWREKALITPLAALRITVRQACRSFYPHMSDDPDRTLPAAPPQGSSTSGKSWQPPSAEELHAMLPQYEITALLGRGGMGAVYKGTQTNLDRPVAIKILPPGLDENNVDANYSERFKNEARSMAKLAHPGIVSVYDFGEAPGGILYIVMEFIEGTDVQKMVSEQGRLHSAHALAVTAHVCDALQYAHARGIVHRDIKPANIMVGYDGVVKVADFGLAKMSKAGESGLTRSGVAMGTLHYMAPEALMLGTSVDHRADIYAVGVMLYYMLTGKLPQGMFELPSLQIPGLDPRYDKIIAKALRDDRDIRYQSAAELRQDLDGILTQPVVKVEPGTREAQPALPTEVRPQRPEGGRRTVLRPQERVEVRVERRGSPLLWASVFVLGGFAIWTVLNRSQLEPSKSEENATVTKTNPPATLPVEVTTPSQVTTPSPNTSMPAPLPPPAIGVWQNLLVEDLRQTLDFQSGRYADLVREPGAEADKPRYRSQANMMIFAKPSLKNGAIRARFGPGWQNNPPHLMVRYQGPGRFISNSIFNNSICLRRVFMTSSGQTSYSDFARKNLSSTVIPSDQTYEIELKAIDSKFTLLKDGEIVLEGTDSNYTDGRVGFFIEKGAVVESLEYMILPANTAEQPPQRVVSNQPESSADGWRSLLAEKPNLLTQFNASEADSSGWRTLQKGFMPLLEAENAALRVKGRGTQNAVVLIAGWNEVGTDSKHGFRAHVGTDQLQSRLYSGWINGLENVNGVRRPISYMPVGPPPLLEVPARGEYELEFRLHGRALDVLVGGKIVSQMNDLSLPGDWLAIDTAGPAQLKSLEWRPLDAQGNPLPAEPPPASKPQAEQQRLTAQYEAAIAKQVTPAVAAYALSIQGSYAAALERAIKTPNTSPAVVEALKKEIQRLTSSKTVPDKDAPGTPAGLSVLRDTYRKAVETFRVQKTAPVKAIYDQQLKALEKNGSTASSNHATKTTAVSNTPFTNSLGMKFVPVPITGGPTNGKRVLFSVWETRVQDYEVFVKETKRMWRKPPFEQGPTHPAVNVNWEDAVAFCTWLTGHERTAGRLGLQEAYRLPSDHEWSCAAGIGGREDAASPPNQKSQNLTDAFLWGSQWPPPPGAGNFHGEEMVGSLFFQTQGILNGYSDGFVRTASAGTFPPNSLGIFDLSGNVSEFCEDWYDPTQKSRVTRGASWGKDLRNDLLLSFRDKHPPNFQNIILGFRCVIAPAPSAAAASPSPSPQVSSSSVASATKDAPFTNSLGMKFVPVPNTKVLMCVHETRVQDFRAFVTATQFDYKKGGLTLYGGVENPNLDWEHQTPEIDGPVAAEQPVLNVSWDDAQAFNQWLTQHEHATGRLPPGHTYRLPTEAEWSSAIGTGPYGWGAEWPPPPMSGNFSNYVPSPLPNDFIPAPAWDTFKFTSPAGSFPPNALGIHDLDGNAAELGQDVILQNGINMVRRHGSSFASQRDPRSLGKDYRHNRSSSSHRHIGNGFRCVVEINP